ncbi:hypothetical protein Acsp04_64870 [Actinomadura sp. NBRC 104425]|nr:hypothetical protein Acsp04_64870 [Actinomadura sp. NBRC 104425]
MQWTTDDAAEPGRADEWRQALILGAATKKTPRPGMTAHLSGAVVPDHRTPMVSGGSSRGRGARRRGSRKRGPVVPPCNDGWTQEREVASPARTKRIRATARQKRSPRVRA